MYNTGTKCLARRACIKAYGYIELGHSLQETTALLNRTLPANFITSEGTIFFHQKGLTYRIYERNIEGVEMLQRFKDK